MDGAPGLWIFSIINLFMIFFGLIGTAFWIWMIIDCLRYDEERHIYIWLLIFFYTLGALIYFFLRKLPRMKMPKIKALQRWRNRRVLEEAQAAAHRVGNAHQYVQLGQALLDSRWPERAAEACRMALEKEPENARALWIMAQALMELKAWPEALPVLRKLMEIDPKRGYGDASLAYGRALVQLGHEEEAREHLARHLRSWGHPEAHYLLADLLRKAGDMEKAKHHLHEVVMAARGAPRFQSAHNRKWMRRARKALTAME